MKNKVPLIFGILFSLTGALSIFYVINRLNIIEESKSWLSTEALVKHIEITSSTSSSTSGKHRRTIISYGIDLLYEFSVNNKKYLGDTLTFRSINSSYKEVYKKANKYKIGQKITIYYSADDPEKNVAELGGAGSYWIIGLVAVVFFLVGVFFLIWQIKSKKTL